MLSLSQKNNSKTNDKNRINLQKLCEKTKKQKIKQRDNVF